MYPHVWSENMSYEYSPLSPDPHFSEKPPTEISHQMSGADLITLQFGADAARADGTGSPAPRTTHDPIRPAIRWQAESAPVRPLGGTVDGCDDGLNPGSCMPTPASVFGGLAALPTIRSNSSARNTVRVPQRQGDSIDRSFRAGGEDR